MLPLTLLGGYLGSGKTTLVNHLLRNANGMRLAILVNEFGALPIDEDLIEAQDEDIISIAGGCVCCSYGNDLTLALLDMVKLDPPPDHVLLEASGVALPGAIAASVSLLQGYQLDGIILMTNAETIEEQAHDDYVGDTIMGQLKSADLIVLNKTDLVTARALAHTKAWLTDQAHGADILPAVRAQLPPATILRTFLGRDDGGPAAANHTNHANHANHESDMFETCSFVLDGPVDVEALAKGLACAELGLVRAKGFAGAADGAVHTIQTVGRRFETVLTTKNVAPGLVAIGPKSVIDRDAVAGLIERCSV